MSKIGKIDLEIFEKFVMENLGKRNKNVIVPPQTGVDASVIDVGNGKVLIIAEDPIFPTPGEPLDTFGWYAVHIGASDIAVMGVKPEYMTYSLLMPPDTKDEDFRAIVNSIHKAAKEMDISIVGGHTGYYPAVNVPIIGGITVFTIADEDDYVTPKGAKIGDKVIITKGPAIEATGLLATVYEKELIKKLSPQVVEKAKGYLRDMTVIKDALVAKSCGGVTAMHDATEGGVIGGLFEVANASEVGMIVDEKKIVFPDEIKMVMESLGIDAVKAISEGTLIITASPDKADNIVKKLEKEGIPSSVAGEVTPKERGRTLIRLDGTKEPLKIPEQDPFWPAFFKGLGDIKNGG